MANNKNLIEIIKIEGLDISIQRQNGNCWVNLTNMAKRYGKKPYAWICQEETKEFLAALSEVRNLHFTTPEIGNPISEESTSVAWIHATKSVMRISITKPQDFIITRQGGSENSNQFSIPKVQKYTLGNQELIITRKGGSLSHRGTWCTFFYDIFLGHRLFF